MSRRPVALALANASRTVSSSLVPRPTRKAGGTSADSDPRGSGSWFVGLKYRRIDMTMATGLARSRRTPR